MFCTRSMYYTIILDFGGIYSIPTDTTQPCVVLKYLKRRRPCVPRMLPARHAYSYASNMEKVQEIFLKMSKTA